MKIKFLSIAAALLFTAGAQAQYTVIHNFGEGLGEFNDTLGAVPCGSLTLSGSVLYGMTYKGGIYYTEGCIFSVDTDGSNYKVLWNFYDTSGFNPEQGSLILSANKLYGMTTYGGSNNNDGGVIFSINTDGTGYKDLYNLGCNPWSSLTISGSVLYGMSEKGGMYGYGNIFSINTDGTGYKDLWEFDRRGDTNGAAPAGSLTLLGSKLYGMTMYGGINYWGNIFSIDTNGSGYKDLFDFNYTNGAGPEGNLIISGGVMYGMTVNGGADGDGCIFSINTDGTGYKVLLDFNGKNGYYAYGTLTLCGNVLYGTTAEGGANNDGVVFSINTDGTGYKDLLDFNGTNGNGPALGEALIPSGDILYGTAQLGGLWDDGVIFGFKVGGLGLDNILVNSGLVNIYPNPSTGKFTIQLPGLRGRSLVEVYNVFGQKVCSFAEANNSQFSIDLSTQPAGLYLYRVVTPAGALIGSGKVLIQ